MQVGAINDEEEITALGHHLAALPVDVRIGKVCNFGYWIQHILDGLNDVVVKEHQFGFYQNVIKVSS